MRPNVCIVIVNKQQQVLWAERTDGGWQFPQGGIDDNETEEDALYREMHEEVGLKPKHTQLLGKSDGWFDYDIPVEHQVTNKKSGQKITGQRQRWFLLRLLAKDSKVNLNVDNDPELKQWRWVNYWYPLHAVIEFKQEAYRQGLATLAPLLTSKA